MTEPNIEQALSWWSELPDKWTPVGWKDHLFRFNIEFNGAIVALPNPHARLADWNGLGVQLTVCPSEDLRMPYYRGLWRDDNSVVQGWVDCPAPVLWSQWAVDGLLLREEVFAHVPGADDVETGTEPLFLWIRLSVADRCEELPLEEHCGFLFQINAPCIGHSMSARNNTEYIAAQSRYPRELAPESETYDPKTGWRLIEADGKVRLAVAPGQECETAFQTHVTNSRNHSLYYHEKSALRMQLEETDSLLHVRMSSRLGTSVDLLLPMLPTDPETFDAELALGYNVALEEANRYWARVPDTAARLTTPESYVNRAVENSLKLAETIAETNRETGLPALLLGSWSYAVSWATPIAMTINMLLDTFGHHAAAEKYLEIFRDQQGTVKPPSPYIEQHPGYLSTPASLRAIDWLSDHGAILWAVCEHALLTDDQDFIEKWTPSILKACEFIRESRANRDHQGVRGLMPPARATDSGTHIQAVWNDGWVYKGLSTAVRLMRRIGHRIADELEAEARDYRETFAKAIRAKAATMPVWTDGDGNQHHLVPTSIYGDQKWETRFCFYLDTGPLFLVFAGLLDADDELMRSTLKWFREGPQTRFYRLDSNWSQVPCLRHEISSCEPIYSFNVFHPHQLGDREKFLEGMYSLFTGYISQQTFTMCEHRGGVCGLTPALVPGYMARLALVDDQIVENELHLLRLVPLAWLREDRPLVCENIPTEYGPVSLTVKILGDTLDVFFEPRFRREPGRIVLHVPPVDGLARVAVNRRVKWDGKSEDGQLRSFTISA